MSDIEEQKSEQRIKLEQKKNRLIAEEAKLKVNERKKRTRQLIEIGGLVVKAGLDNLPTNTFYGAILSLKHSLEKQPTEIKDQWTKLGKEVLDQEQKQRVAVIIKFDDKPSIDTRSQIRNHSLKWNNLRQEWYGYVNDLESLKSIISNLKHELQIIT